LDKNNWPPLPPLPRHAPIEPLIYENLSFIPAQDHGEPIQDNVQVDDGQILTEDSIQDHVQVHIQVDAQVFTDYTIQDHVHAQVQDDAQILSDATIQDHVQVPIQDDDQIQDQVHTDVYVEDSSVTGNYLKKNLKKIKLNRKFV
jgi:hypothetical protein